MATAPICSCLEVPDDGGHQEVIKRSSRGHQVSLGVKGCHQLPQ